MHCCKCRLNRGPKMMTIRNAQKLCLALAAISLAVGLYAAFTAGQLEAELLDRLRAQGPSDPGIALFSSTPSLRFFQMLQHHAFLTALVTAGGFLVLDFNARAWPYRLYVPAIALSSFAAWAGDIYMTTSASLVLLLGPVGALGAGWIDDFKVGSLGLLIVSVPLYLSARAGSPGTKFAYLSLFAVLWLSMGVVTALFIGFIDIEPASGFPGAGSE